MVDGTLTIGMVTEGVKALGGLGLLVWILLKQTRLETQMKSITALGELITAHDRELVGIRKDIERNTKDLNAAHGKYRDLANQLTE